MFPALKPPTRIFPLTLAAIRANPGVVAAFLAVNLLLDQIVRQAPPSAFLVVFAAVWIASVTMAAVVVFVAIRWYFGHDDALTPSLVTGAPLRGVILRFLWMMFLATLINYVLYFVLMAVTSAGAEAGQAPLGGDIVDPEARLAAALAWDAFSREHQMMWLTGAWLVGLPAWIYIELFMGLRLPVLALGDSAMGGRTDVGRIDNRRWLVSRVFVAYLLGAALPDLAGTMIVGLTEGGAAPELVDGEVAYPAAGFDPGTFMTDLVYEAVSLFGLFALALVLAEAYAHHLRRSVAEHAKVFA